MCRVTHRKSLGALAKGKYGKSYRLPQCAKVAESSEFKLLHSCHCCRQLVLGPIESQAHAFKLQSAEIKMNLLQKPQWLVPFMFLL